MENLQKTGERIDKQLKEMHDLLEKLVNRDYKITETTKTTPEELASKFGLPLSQAKAWLKREPNYSSDVS
jgi:predicted mannosyl-3-phosphoglycerate phosphatase (HAD superfamily)